MKVVLTSSGPTLADPIDMHFGRAKVFILADVETGRAVAHDNAQNLHAAQGAGIQSAETVARLGAEAVVTGSVGPKAYKALQAATVVHAETCSIYFGATYCSCGAVIAGYPIFGTTAP